MANRLVVGDSPVRLCPREDPLANDHRSGEVVIAPSIATPLDDFFLSYDLCNGVHCATLSEQLGLELLPLINLSRYLAAASVILRSTSSLVMLAAQLHAPS